MKNLIAVLALICAVSCFAQTPTPPPTNPANIYAAGMSYNNSGTPAIAGTGLYAHLIADGSGTYAFTVFDAIPTSLKPFTVTSNVGAGIAQKVFSIGSVPIFIPTSAGISWQGSNTGWQWSTGALASFSVNKSKTFKIMPNIRIAKSSVSNGTGYQPVIGILFAYGK
jgi:hypothetical protein